MQKSLQKLAAPPQQGKQMAGRYANYFRLSVSDVSMSDHHETRRDWLQQYYIMLMTPQVCAPICKLLETIATFFCNIMILFYAPRADGVM